MLMFVSFTYFSKFRAHYYYFLLMFSGVFNQNIIFVFFKYISFKFGFSFNLKTFHTILNILLQSVYLMHRNLNLLGFISLISINVFRNYACLIRFKKDKTCSVACYTLIMQWSSTITIDGQNKQFKKVSILNKSKKIVLNLHYIYFIIAIILILKT